MKLMPKEPDDCHGAQGATALLDAKSLTLCAAFSEVGLPFCVRRFCRVRKDRKKEEKEKEQESSGKPRRPHWSVSRPGAH